MAKLTGQSGALAIRIVTWAKDLRFWYGLAAVIIFTAVIILLIMLTRMNLAKADVDALLIEKLGGDTTALSASRDAFSLPAPNLTTEDRNVFEVGESLFNQNWGTAPASAETQDGLGPTFNAQACSLCHILNGRARPPLSNDDSEPGLLFRLSVPGSDTNGNPLGVPVYGDQFQDRSILDVPAEGRFVTTWRERRGSYADGEPYALIEPEYSFDDLAFGPMPADVMVSPRISPGVFGVGLLEAIPEADILARADPDDSNGDGISGRANTVWDVRNGRMALGRFGWKAKTPSVEQQVAGAFHGDIGITSPLFPDENCPPDQTDCLSAPNGGMPELSEDSLSSVAFHNRTLAVPAMRDIENPQVARGVGLFLQADCNACHTPKHITGESDIPALNGQVIHPYTDLLLHDMGDGLADGRPEFQASGREWRTTPLWGIGLVDNVNGHTRFLHDGRARNIAEAILWHGGEGEAARQSFLNMSSDERDALLRFLESL